MAFYQGTKKRISVSNGAIKGPSISESIIENPSEDYKNLREQVLNICDQFLINQHSEEEQTKILWLRSRVDIEL